MTGSGSLPELGPYLGRLTDATRRFDDPALGLDQIRLALVSNLFERAQAARAFLAVGDTPGARASLDRAGWLALWREAVGQVTERATAVIAERFEAARRTSRCPNRVARHWAPTAEDREMMAAKFEAAGLVLEERVERPATTDAEWWEQVRRSAVALDDAWEELERLLRLELASAADRVAPVASWRPSTAPVVVAFAILAAAAGWLGLALGGIVPRPSWLDGVHAAFWRLPWP